MSTLKRPFYVTFIADHPDAPIDHTRRQPGPDDGVERAGYTIVSLPGRGALQALWGRGPGNTVYARGINIRFRLTDYIIRISSDLHVGRCAYEATMRHEREAHILDAIRIFHSYRARMVDELNAIDIPTERDPWPVTVRATAAGTEATVMAQVVAAVGHVRNALSQHLDRARLQHDSAASYRIVYRQCTAAEWEHGN
jgi:hypothetical protein